MRIAHRGRTALAAAAALLLAGCLGEPDGPAPAGRSGDGAPVTITAWFHTGKPAERATIEEQVAAFNAANDDVAVELVLIPEQGYHVQVESALAAGELPDVLDVDGPYLANLAWKGAIVPLDDLLPTRVVEDLLPSIRAQGRYAGGFYGVGTFDSGLGLYADRRALAAAGVRIPQGIDDAWTAAELDEALHALRGREEAAGGDGAVLDLKLNYQGEWFTYAFSPAVQSAGADLVERTHPPRAGGTLDGDGAVRALTRIQGWIGGDLVDPNSDDRAFVDRRVALSWSGHWDFPRYREALGDDLLVLPLPDFGEGSRTGMGSWAWAVTAASAHPQAAARFVAFLLEDEQVLAMTQANGAVPATRGAVAASDRYGPDGPLRLFAEQLRRSAVPRPVTPAYPAITEAFQDAFAAIRRGEDARAALEKAAARIDRDVAANDGYPPPPAP